MIETISLLPGITLRYFPDNRFKQGCLSLQIVRPMCREEAAVNALIPAILLRGCDGAPDLRSITLRLDDLYGASVGTLVRRIGDYQTTGLYCGFISDRYAMSGDAIFAPMVDFLGELLFHPLLEKGAFRKDFVESEKKNLISTIESQKNDKRAYAFSQLLRHMCKDDSFGIPRLGEVEQVAKITPRSAYDHYRKILRESRIDLFYVGDAPAAVVAEKLKSLFSSIDRDYVNLPEQTAFSAAPAADVEETMDISQGKLAIGYTSDITIRDDAFANMQVFNTLFGGGMTSKLFMNVREKLSLCYDISSGYHGAKGILTVAAGIDCEKKETVLQEIETQLQACRQGDISDDELAAAKEALISALRSAHDTPGSIENYYASAALSGFALSREAHMEKIAGVTAEDLCKVAKGLTQNTVYFLKGVS